MPLFQTGNPMWDQNLNSLAGIFPDPAKQAQAGYYGAEAGKALQEAEILRYQQGKIAGLPTSWDEMLRQGMPLPGVAPAPTPTTTAPAAPPPPLADTIAPAPASVPGPVPGPAAAPVAAQPTAQPTPTPTPTPTMAPPPANAGAMGPGGVNRAPQAQANGAPGFDIIPLITQLTQGHLPNEMANRMVGAVLNGLVSHGMLDPRTANEQLGRLGQPTMYGTDVGAQTQITTTGMNNATTLATTRLTEAGQTQRKGMDEINVIRRADNTVVPVSRAELLAHPELYTTYDSSREIAGDKPEPVTLPDGTPGYSQTRNMARPGVKPLNQSDMVPVVPVTGGPIRLMSRAQVQAQPGVWRDAQPSDYAPTQTVGPTGPKATTTAETLNAPGVTPLPTSTDQGNAQTTAMLMDALRNGDIQKAQTLMGAMQEAQSAQIPKQVITPSDQAKMDEADLSYFNNMYPPPSGVNIGTSTLPAGPTPNQLAYFNGLRRILQNGPFRNAVAAAGPAAWEMMRASGIIPKDAKDRGVGVTAGVPGYQGGFPNVTGGKESDQRIFMGDDKQLPRDAQGNFDYSGFAWAAGTPSLGRILAPEPAPGRTGQPPGPRAVPAPTAPAGPAKSLAETVAPGPAGASAMPPGAISAAPPGARDGQVFQQNGVKGVARGGWVFPAP